MVFLSPNMKLKAEIIIEYGSLKPMIAWLQRNCIGDWTYDCVIPAGRDGGMYEFYFEEERDYTTFVLWKQ